MSLTKTEAIAIFGDVRALAAAIGEDGICVGRSAESAPDRRDCRRGDPGQCSRQAAAGIAWRFVDAVTVIHRGSAPPTGLADRGADEERQEPDAAAIAWGNRRARIWDMCRILQACRAIAASWLLVPALLVLLAFFFLIGLVDELVSRAIRRGT